ncbi:AraC family transcriptional regulator [Thalassospira alkalitolerans]|uniref:Transcriptional regulator n=1 Tax=Thalassospira alkalitolerans TaxID=1293890 RepID=A0A1Y2L9C4_9PROT|nr:AraC family transcriptional regulator [Thalassospira alkalitolerans]OSQ47050.1 transcriptional regulator [Thalassospira alkalitolerans]
MTFHPQMNSQIEGITLLDDLRFHRWDAAISDLWHVECAERAGGTYISRAPRLVAILDCIGDARLQVRTLGNNASAACPEQGCLSFIPAGMEISSEIHGKCRLRHLDIHLDVEQIEKTLGYAIDKTMLETPRIGFCDPRIKSLVQLIADDVAIGSAGPQLYGESLVTALMTALLDARPENEPPRKRGRLAPHQLRKSIDYIEENCNRTIRLDELAQLTGLSQSYFCSAFRQSTGMPPNQWQMKARVDRAKEMLSEKDTSLAGIAANVGFADQAHLTRVFRRIVGTTPGAWRKEQIA